MLTQKFADQTYLGYGLTDICVFLLIIFIRHSLWEKSVGAGYEIKCNRGIGDNDEKK